jgi:hypothetical protein
VAARQVATARHRNACEVVENLVYQASDASTGYCAISRNPLIQLNNVAPTTTVTPNT